MVDVGSCTTHSLTFLERGPVDSLCPLGIVDDDLAGIGIGGRVLVSDGDGLLEFPHGSFLQRSSQCLGVLSRDIAAESVTLVGADDAGVVFRVQCNAVDASPIGWLVPANAILNG